MKKQEPQETTAGASSSTPGNAEQNAPGHTAESIRHVCEQIVALEGQHALTRERVQEELRAQSMRACGREVGADNTVVSRVMREVRGKSANGRGNARGTSGFAGDTAPVGGMPSVEATVRAMFLGAANRTIGIIEEALSEQRRSAMSSQEAIQAVASATLAETRARLVAECDQVALDCAELADALDRETLAHAQTELRATTAERAVEALSHALTLSERASTPAERDGSARRSRHGASQYKEGIPRRDTA